MRAADRSFALLLIGCALATCGQAPQEAPNNAAAVDIETLPPDESAEPPANEVLEAGDPPNADAARP